MQETSQSKLNITFSVHLLLPFGIMFVLVLLLLVPSTHKFAVWLLGENHPIEMLTSIIAFWATIEGIRLFKLLQKHQPIVVSGFIVLFTFMMFLLAMEEISWGQQLFGFETPEFWRTRNSQQELTLHNYNFVGVDYLVIYLLLFAIGGLIGMTLRIKSTVPWVICPSSNLWPWFLIVLIHSAIDLSHEFYILSPAFDELVNHLDEASEFIVACCGMLYLRLNRHELVLQEGL